jgi:hypothetical protein
MSFVRLKTTRVPATARRLLTCLLMTAGLGGCWGNSLGDCAADCSRSPPNRDTPDTRNSREPHECNKQCYILYSRDR